MWSTWEWGEFFPHEMSPFGYNETVAHEPYPLTRGDVENRGWKWFWEKDRTYSWTAYQPLSIDQYDEAVVGAQQAKENIQKCLSGTLVCEQTRKPFKIVGKELAFYIQNGISLPRFSPEVRRKERMDQRNPHRLWGRTCDRCGKDIQTTYEPGRPERIYCEKCYRKEIY